MKVVRGLSFMLFTFCLFLFVSCGLEAFYYLDPPQEDRLVLYTNSDRTLDYFSFRTNEGSEPNISLGEFEFLGTEVYYKIYRSSSAMTSCQSSISSITNGTDASAAAEKLIDSYGYKTLRFVSPKSQVSIVKDAQTPRYVYIRLNHFQGESEDNPYTNVVCTGRTQMKEYDSSWNTEGSGVDVYFPRRNINSSYGFNFNSKDENSPVPKNGDEDVTWSDTATEEGCWYIDMYAVSVGRDTSFTTSYSEVLHLGSITVRESEYDEYN